MNRFFILIFSFLTLVGFAQEQEKVADKRIECYGEPPPMEKGAEVYTVVQEMPQFPGGAGEMMKFIHKNFHYPKTEIESGITGKCFIKFIVEPDGSLSNVEVLKSVAGRPNYDKEAVRVVESMPKWIAGKQNEKPVRVYYNLPLTICLQ